MQLYFEGIDISAKVGISFAEITDSAGGQLDGVDATFADTEGNWSQWQPAADNTILLRQEGFSSGVCYVDEIGQQYGQYILQGVSMPSGAKAARSRSWERATLLEIISDMAGGLGYGFATYGTANPVYQRMDQMGVTDMAFLSELCAREGYALKVNDRRVIVYDEATFEAVTPVRKITGRDFLGEWEYTQHREGTYAGCRVSYGSISAEYIAAGRAGEMLDIRDQYLSSVGEAQRYARGMLRQANRLEHSITGGIKLDLSLAGGSMVEVTEVGTANGLYMVDQVRHRLTEGISGLKLRRKLEGY